MRNLKPTCAECASDQVCLDSVNVTWDTERQCWDLESYHTEIDCLECDYRGDPHWIED